MEQHGELTGKGMARVVIRVHVADLVGQLRECRAVRGPVTIAALIAGAFIVYRHKANLHRIRAGNEHVFRFGAR